ncbi:MAG TPA: efflux RND transporter permease subunit, partial [Candidatus Omnitrophica bacterium]|nr:efflux RND transporter permease subunit [Candidatus Omnitrophota bacterium]
MTLVGLCLGAGMLLDSSIVVCENILKKKEKCSLLSREEIIKSSEEVNNPILASVLTTIIVFLPFIFINKETQKIYSGIAWSIIFSLIGSVFIALSLVPSLSFLFLRKEKEKPKNNHFFKKVEKFYKNSLNFILGFHLLIFYLLIFFIIFPIFLFQKLDKEFIGIPEENKFTIFIELPTGTKLDITDKIVKKVEKLIEKYRTEGEVKQYSSRIEPYSAKIYVEMMPREKRKLSPSQLISLLRKETEKLSPAFIYYQEAQSAASKEIIIDLYGYDYNTLKELARKVGEEMKKIPGLTDIKLRAKEGGPEIKIILDKERLSLLGLDTQSVATKLHGKLRGLIPTRFRPIQEAYLTTKREKKKKEEKEPSSLKALYSRYTKEIEMITRLEEKFREGREDIEKVILFSPRGERAYLSQIAEFKIDVGPSQIWRKNKRRMIQVSANRRKIALGRVAKEMEKNIKNIKFPENYSWGLGGDYEKMVRNQKELRWALLFALILVYLVLASFFENLRQPFIILSSVALAFAGSIVILYLKKQAVGIGVLIGLTLLIGIVVNNAIILVDAINKLRKKFSLKESITRASLLRLRPILMTTSTTVLSFLPLLIFKTEASALWHPLALTIIGGLSISCLLTLYVLPSLYMTYSSRSLK